MITNLLSNINGWWWSNKDEWVALKEKPNNKRTLSCWDHNIPLCWKPISICRGCFENVRNHWSSKNDNWQNYCVAVKNFLEDYAKVDLLLSLGIIVNRTYILPSKTDRKPANQGFLVDLAWKKIIKKWCFVTSAKYLRSKLWAYLCDTCQSFRNDLQYK